MGLSTGLLRPPYSRGWRGPKRFPPFPIVDWTFTLRVGVSRRKSDGPDTLGRLPGESAGPPSAASGSRGRRHRDALASATFWNSLSPVEKRAINSVAYKRTFAAGATLMQEGEQADHVIVILRGWTKICVQETEGERIIAERGPGQLVGERAALHVSLRSATVIALEMVQALVMKTEDFAAFITAHPTVLDVVEGEVYNRLVGRQGVVGFDRPLALSGENCTVVLTDVAGFAARNRTDEDRRIVRQAIFDMTRTALGTMWDECVWEDRGDGLLMVIPPHIATTRVMEYLLNGLPLQLKRHNHISSDSVRIQLRVAVDVGPVVSDPMGMSGEAIILVARLQDTTKLKQAMGKSGANLGVIVSNFVYESAIRHGGGLIDPSAYGQVPVNVKETQITAWMQLIDPAPPHVSMRLRS